MKILYVDLEYDYGIESRGINHIGQDGFLKSFIDLGNEVVSLYYDDYLENIIPLQEKIKNLAKEVKPDLIFFCLFSNQFEIETLEYLKSKYVTINWFGDDPWRFGEFSSKYARHFSYCITTDKYAKKYALGNLFLIDDTEDADATNQHGKGVAAKVAANPTKIKITADQMKKALEFIQGGGSVDAIKSKYILTKDQEAGLTRTKISK